jgi:hypothetical protein
MVRKLSAEHDGLVVLRLASNNSFSLTVILRWEPDVGAKGFPISKLEPPELSVLRYKETFIDVLKSLL